MEVEEELVEEETVLDEEVVVKTAKSVLTSTPSSIRVSLHPLVVLNISDHFTRARMQREEGGTASG